MMFKPQSALQNHAKTKPFKENMTALSWGKIVARHPEDNSFDVACQSGGTFQHVPMATNLLGSQVGTVYLPENDLTAPIASPHGTWDVPLASTKADLWAILGFLEGSSRQPVILGFLPPLQSQMTFQTAGIKVERHESGVFWVTTPDGQVEVNLPDGSSFIMGGTTPHDMQSENPNWSPKTVATPLPITINHASGTTIKILPSGEVEINSVAGITLSASAIASAVVGTGAHPVGLGDLIESAFNAHTHLGNGAGNQTAIPTQQMSGVSATNLTTD